MQTRLRHCARHTGLDAVAELLNEAADAYDREVEARKQAQAQAEDLKGAVLRAETNAEQYANSLLLKLVADIRFACGDNGKRMQPELVEHIKAITADAERYRWLLANYATGDGYDNIDKALNDGDADTKLSAAIDAARKDTK